MEDGAPEYLENNIRIANHAGSAKRVGFARMLSIEKHRIATDVLRQQQ